MTDNKRQETLYITNKNSIQKLKYGSEFKDLLDARDQVLQHEFDFTIRLETEDFTKDTFEKVKKKMLKQVFEHIQEFLVESASNIVSVAFKFLNKEDLMDLEAKNYSANNLMLNLHSIFSEVCTAMKNSPFLKKAIQAAELDEQAAWTDIYYLLAIKAENIYNNILANLADLYPQAQPTGGTPRMREVLKEINKVQEEENDLILANNIKIKDYINKEGDYTQFIMEVINKAIKVTQTSEEDSRKRTTMEIFTQFSEQLFWLSQQKDQIVKNKYIPEFFDQVLQRNPEHVDLTSKNLGQNETMNPTKIKLDTKAQNKKRTDFLDKVKSEFHLGIETMKQKPKFLMGSKIPAFVKEFTELEIRNKQFSAKHSSILRILTKWAEYLNQFFKEPERNVYQRQFKFKTTDNKLVTIYNREKLVEQLKKEGETVKEKYEFLQKNCYEWIGKLMSEKIKKGKKGHVCRYSDTRVLASKINSVLSHLMLNYLNLLIHHLVKAGNHLTIENGKTDHISLVVFRISDLMRSKLQCSQRSFINLLETMYKLNNDERMRGKFKIVRIKNKLDEVSSNIFINYLFMDKVQCELQLSIQNLKDKEKTYFTFSHFVYELTRGKFGTLAECVIMISQLDPMISASKGSYYLEKTIEPPGVLKIFQKEEKIEEFNSKIFKNEEKQNQDEEFFFEKQIKPEKIDSDESYEEQSDYSSEYDGQILLNPRKQVKALSTDQFKTMIEKSVFECKDCKRPIIKEDTTLFMQSETFKICNACNLEKEKPQQYLKNQKLRKIVEMAIDHKEMRRITSYLQFSKINDFKCIAKIEEYEAFSIYLCIKVKEQLRNFLVRIDKSIIEQSETKKLKYQQLDSINVTEKIKKDKESHKRMSEFWFILKDFNEDIAKKLAVQLPSKEEGYLAKFVAEFRDFRLEKTLIKTIKSKAGVIDANFMSAKFNKLGKVIKSLEEKAEKIDPTPDKKQTEDKKDGVKVGEPQTQGKLAGKGQAGKKDSAEKVLEEDESTLKYQNFTDLKLDDIQYIHAKGIELRRLPLWLNKFTNLLSLDLGQNKLNNNDLNSIPEKLTHLYLSINNLNKKIDLSKLTNLHHLDLSQNQISQIMVDGLNKLEYLNLNNNSMEGQLKLQANPKLKTLEINNNRLTELFLCLPNLQQLQLQNNNLAQVTLKNMNKLKNLYLQQLQLSKIHLEDIQQLSTLNCTENKLSQMMVKKVKNLQELIVSDNQLTQIEFNCENGDKKVCVDQISSKNLTFINLKSNHLSSISFGRINLTKLTKLEISNNKIQHLDIQELVNIKELYVSSNQIKQFQCKDLLHLEILKINNNNLTKLELESLPKLTNLGAARNSLESLSLIKLSDLAMIWLDNNQLSQLKISQLPKLQSLILNNNKFAEIEINSDGSDKKSFIDSISCGNLNQLNISENQISSFSFGKTSLPKLTELNLTENKIEFLDIQHLVAIKSLKISKNQLKEFKCEDKKNLLVLKVNNNLLQKIQLKNLQSLYDLGVANNKLKSLELKDLPKLKKAWFDNNEIQQISKLENLPEIDHLDISDNKIKVLKIHNLPKLDSLDASNNILEVISLSQLPLLAQFNNIFYNNATLKVLNISNLKNLMKIDTTESPLEEVHLKDLPSLRNLILQKNNLTSIELDSFPKLEELYFSVNKKLRTLSLKNLPKLKRLDFQDCAVSNLKELPPSLELMWCEEEAVSTFDFEKLPNLKQLKIHKKEIAREKLINLKKEVELVPPNQRFMEERHFGMSFQPFEQSVINDSQFESVEPELGDRELLQKS